MKILQLDPMCGIPVPPPTWGAIEKIVWEFKCNLDLLGYDTDIRMRCEYYRDGKAKSVN